jgi:hypothetical protein
VTTAEQDLVDRAVAMLRRAVTAPAPAGTLHFGLFALARLLEEIAHAGAAGAELPEPVRDAALEIAQHVVDHGVHVTVVPRSDHQEEP